mgnify:CR=1 FL=1
MSEIITQQSERVTRFLSTIDRMMGALDNLSKNHAPRFGGEHYVTDAELTEMLKVSDRTTQDWRSSGKIDYIQFEKKGKILYRESDIQKILEKHYLKSWQ